MEELGLVGDLAVVAVAALIGGSIARILRLPTILGYLTAGLVIGPNTPGIEESIEQVQTVADLGVALLMFTLGIRFSLREMRAVRGLAIGGGLLQIGVMVGVGLGVGLAVGLQADEAAIVGFVVAISSTMIALRLLEERGVMGGPEGKVGVAFALFQDMAVVPFIVLIPVIAGEEGNLAVALGLAALKAIGVLAVIWLVGLVVMPRILERVTLARSRELFLLVIVAFALGTASLSFLAGLSLAFGAFLAGLLLSESEYAHQTLAEVFPLREIFAVVFFVAVGMLIDLQSFVDDPELVMSIAAIGVFGKLILVSGIASAFGFSPRSSFTAGLALGNMGEFSFIIATAALSEGVFDAALTEAVLAAVLLSIVGSSLLFMVQDRLWGAMRGVPVLRPLLEVRMETFVPEPERLRNHAIIVGFNQASEELARAFEGRGFTYVVIDPNPVNFRKLSAEGIRCILGDASLPTVLEQAQPERARVLAVTLTDVTQGDSVVRGALRVNPDLDIIARGGMAGASGGLGRAGATEVVEAEFEVGLEFARHALHRLGVSGSEIQMYLSGRRRTRAERS